MSEKLDKIKKLLALSKSTNEHEAALALAAAMKIASEEGVDLEKMSLTDDEILAQSYTLEPQSKKIEQWKSYLWARIARVFGCTIFMNTFLNQDLNVRYRIKIAGRKQDIEIADYVGVYLQRELEKLSRKNMAEVRKRRKLSPQKLRDSYLIGAATRIIAAVEKLYQAPETAAIGTAYALVLSRADQAQQWVKAKPGTRLVKYKDRLDDKAFDHGYAHGSGVSVHKGLSSSQSPHKQLGE